MNTKNNQRYKDSEKRIQDALMKLMEHPELEDVTVMDICKEAHINRATFYAHYEDIYDLMFKVERLIRQDLHEEFRAKGVGMQNVFQGLSQILCKHRNAVQIEQNLFKAEVAQAAAALFSK